MAIRYSTSMLIGCTTRGVTVPVFFDLHTPIFNNRPPGIFISGAPGSGKTFLALTLTTISAISGKTTIVLDPKGDFLPLINLEKEIGKFNLWNLGDSKRKGILDPFYMAEDPGEKLSLAISVIDLFVGGLDSSQLTALSPIVKDVIESHNPSLTQVMNNLRGSTRQEARDLGTKLDLISRMPFAKLCFAPSNRSHKNVEINKGLTVITLIGMELPADAESASKDNKGRLASGILFLLTDFIRRVMRNDESDNPKSLIIDEAWAVLASEAGARTIKEVALLGRSKKLALVLISQTAAHLKGLDIENTITTRFAFKSSTKDAESTVNDMDLPLNEGFEDVITDLDTGECLMQDWRDRYSTVQISNWKTDWNLAFESNPLVKAENRKAAEARKAQLESQ
jgi:type IV secretory pathway VirB4 component